MQRTVGRAERICRSRDHQETLAFGIGHTLRLGIVLGRTLLGDSVSNCYLILIVCDSDAQLRQKIFFRIATTSNFVYIRAYLAEKARMPLCMPPCRRFLELMGCLKPCCPRRVVSLCDSKTKEQKLRSSCYFGRHLWFQLDTVPVVQVSHWGRGRLCEVVRVSGERRDVLSKRQVK